MALKRVITYYMHEREANAARPLMQNAQETESFMAGDVEEADLARLRAEGLMVYPVDQPKPPALVERTFAPRALSRGLRFRYGASATVRTTIPTWPR